MSDELAFAIAFCVCAWLLWSARRRLEALPFAFLAVFMVWDEFPDTAQGALHAAASSAAVQQALTALLSILIPVAAVMWVLGVRLSDLERRLRPIHLNRDRLDCRRPS